MRREWPQFGITAGTSPMSVMWFGPLVGMELSFTLSVQYGLPLGGRSDLFRLIPLVRVLSPSLVLNFDAEQEAPLPHVYFEGPDYRLSPLCLFDPAAGQWNASMSIARTTIPWAARWLSQSSRKTLMNGRCGLPAPCRSRCYPNDHQPPEQPSRWHDRSLCPTWQPLSGHLPVRPEPPWHDPAT